MHPGFRFGNSKPCSVFGGWSWKASVFVLGGTSCCWVSLIKVTKKQRWCKMQPWIPFMMQLRSRLFGDSENDFVCLPFEELQIFPATQDDELDCFMPLWISIELGAMIKKQGWKRNRKLLKKQKQKRCSWAHCESVVDCQHYTEITQRTNMVGVKSTWL